VRRIAIALVAVAVAGLTPARASAPARRASGLIARGDLTARVPNGWHALRGWLSGVVEPVPALAVASFPATLSRHTCACGFPNVVHFPRDGAFVFVWEYPPGEVSPLPRRSARFHLARGRPVRWTCSGSSDEFVFGVAGGEALQVEVYLGPAASSTLRTQIEGFLESLRVNPSLPAA
jgi:hypothetical protein